MTTTTTQPPGSVTVNKLTDPNTFSNYLWAAMVITLAGATPTQNNVDNFVSWMTAENGAATWTGTAGRNNPLNNGLGSGGGAGLGSYPDLFTAAEFAAKGINGGIQGAAPIGAALKANAPFSVFHAATIQSGWAQYHYAGSGWASATSPYSVPTVTVADAAKHPSTHNPTPGAAVPGGGTGNVPDLVSGAVQGAVDAVGSAISWTDSLGHLLGDLTSPSWWLRVGMGALGVFLFVTGLVGFVSTTKPGQAAKSDMMAATKDAAVAAVAA